ncbi:galactosyltransferase-related protein [Desulfococcaceae bacterium HSG7]|nr:galactosyltransferase-related protein [Desulfococcaceae bacterium HSG7]
MRYSFKQKIGVLLFDWLKYEIKLNEIVKGHSYHPAWIEICNRAECLEMAPQNQGVRCLWKWTSELHAAKVFPSFGLRLMRRALHDWPIQFRNEPDLNSDNIEISFIIGHKGISRLPNLLSVLKTIAAQQDVAFECIVVEQSEQPEIKQHVPEWVRYIHTLPKYAAMPYSRSYAFNAGARIAKGTLLILHDNDMLIPYNYAAQLIEKHNQGYEVINLKRYIFYMNQGNSDKITSFSKIDLRNAPETIIQNLEAGGSIAITKQAYFNIGGFDESFIGWGGEDNEFWERAQNCSVWPFTYLPLVHLWHTPQVGKVNNKNNNIDLYQELSAIPIGQRIKELKSRNCGNIQIPDTPNDNQL